jgi:hypothetical protein
VQAAGSPEIVRAVRHLTNAAIAIDAATATAEQVRAELAELHAKQAAEFTELQKVHAQTDACSRERSDLQQRVARLEETETEQAREKDRLAKLLEGRRTLKARFRRRSSAVNFSPRASRKKRSRADSSPKYFSLMTFRVTKALWDAKLSKTVNAKVIENWSDAGPEFWKRMKEHVDETTKEPVPLVYLYDENGNPLPGPETLPKTIADLKDDPFRSLIYILIDAGVLEKDPIPFSEFHEAQYYRQKFKEAGFTLENSKEGFDKAVAEAKTLPLPSK